MTASGQPAERSGQVAGLLLIAAAGAGMAIANSTLEPAYHGVLEARIGPFTLHQWIADGLMALFFLLVGLEVKREWLCGRLASPAGRKLPILAAASGMAVPAIIFLAVTGFDPVLAPGWAIPAATDIAFAPDGSPTDLAELVRSHLRNDGPVTFWLRS